MDVPDALAHQPIVHRPRGNDAGNFTHTTPGETVDCRARGKSDSPLLHRLRCLGLLVRLRVLVFHFDEVEVGGLAAHENDRRR